MTARVCTVVVLLVPALAAAAPTHDVRRPHPRDLSALPSYVQRVAPTIVGLDVRNAEGASSSARLGTQRFGSGVIFDARGYAVTVSYLLLDAVAIEARLRDGRKVPARVVGLDLDAGLGVVRLEGAGPWPAAALGRSTDAVVGVRTATVGVDEDGDLVQVPGAVHAIRRFAASWEYMLDRALIVAPASPQWGGSAVVNDRGEVIGIASLRLGEAPHVNLAIPAEKFLPVKDELITAGRVASRPPRPWLGIYTADMQDGLVVSDLSPVGPASRAGVLKGDRVLRVNGVAVGSQAEFYQQLWARRAGDVIEVTVRRDGRVRVIRVTSIDRHMLYRVGE
jgi:S1-C subfamily serine protease